MEKPLRPCTTGAADANPATVPPPAPHFPPPTRARPRAGNARACGGLPLSRQALGARAPQAPGGDACPVSASQRVRVIAAWACAASLKSGIRSSCVGSSQLLASAVPVGVGGLSVPAPVAPASPRTSAYTAPATRASLVACASRPSVVRVAASWRQKEAPNVPTIRTSTGLTHVPCTKCIQESAAARNGQRGRSWLEICPRCDHLLTPGKPCLVCNLSVAAQALAGSADGHYVPVYGEKGA